MDPKRTPRRSEIFQRNSAYISAKPHQCNTATIVSLNHCVVLSTVLRSMFQKGELTSKFNQSTVFSCPDPGVIQVRMVLSKTEASISALINDLEFWEKKSEKCIFFV